MVQAYGGLVVIAVCVLQNAFVEALPDFGVDVSIQGSVAVKGAAVRMEERFAELTAHMNFELVSSYEKLGLLRDQFTYLAGNLTTIGTAFATALNSATTSNSNVGGTFEPVILSLSQLQTVQVSLLDGIIVEIDNLVGHPVRAELEDSFNTIYLSVQNVYGAVIQLIAAIQTSNDPANVNFALVYHLNRAVNVLRANVLPLNYTISATGENIRQADAFLARLASGLQTGETTILDELQRFQRQVGLMANATLHVASCAREEVDGIEMMAEPFLQTLCGVCRAACPLQMAVHSVAELTTTELERVMGVVRRRFDDLAANSMFVQEIIDSFGNIYELGMLLADVTIIKRPYSLYCYNKFALLVEQLIPRLTDGFVVCFRQELKRLRSLQSGLTNMFKTLVHDVEDVVEHLELCTTLHDPSACVSEVASLYEHLATHLEDKLDVIETFSLAESNASYDRLQLCVVHTAITVIYANIPKLADDIQLCREAGPHSSAPEKHLSSALD